MLDAHPRGLLRVRLVRAKGAGAAEVARVGAAANGERLALAAGVLGIGLKQRGDLRRAGVDVEGLHVAALLEVRVEARGKAPELHRDAAARGRGGVARVDGLDEAVALRAHGAANAGELAKLVVCGGDAQRLAVAGVGDLVLQVQPALLGVREAGDVGEKGVGKHADGVQAAGSMEAWPPLPCAVTRASPSPAGSTSTCAAVGSSSASTRTRAVAWPGIRVGDSAAVELLDHAAHHGLGGKTCRQRGPSRRR